MEKIAKISTPQRKNLVYTSAGENTNVQKWLVGKENFDLWITNYGNVDDKLIDVSDFYNYREGGKFPNFHYVYNTWPHIIQQYDAIMVLDDDIIISGRDIGRLFDIREAYDLWILQPTYDPRGKVNHNIRQNCKTFLRYTNFIELGCPLFLREKLDQFMRVYDPKLVGWGIDWWFLHEIGGDKDRKIAVIDDITCINPHDDTKVGGREIEKLQVSKERYRIWTEIREEYGIRNYLSPKVEYEHIKNSKGRILMNIILYVIRRVEGKINKIYNKFNKYR